DNLSVPYRFAAVSENGSALLTTVGFAAGEGRHDLAVRLPNGTVYALTGEPEPSAWGPVNPQAPAFRLLACGQPVAARRAAAEARPPENSLAAPLVLGVVAAAVALGVAEVLFMKKRRG